MSRAAKIEKAAKALLPECIPIPGGEFEPFWEALHAALAEPEEEGAARPRVVCLCGSTRFANEFMAASFAETAAGRIVLSVGGFSRKPDGSWDSMRVTEEQKVILDRLHFRKIEMADEIFVINVGGYVGPSTSNEIAHAKRLGKPIRWLEVPPSRSARASAGDAEAQRCPECGAGSPGGSADGCTLHCSKCGCNWERRAPREP